MHVLHHDDDHMMMDDDMHFSYECVRPATDDERNQA